MIGLSSVLANHNLKHSSKKKQKKQQLVPHMESAYSFIHIAVKAIFRPKEIKLQLLPHCAIHMRTGISAPWALVLRMGRAFIPYKIFSCSLIIGTSVDFDNQISKGLN